MRMIVLAAVLLTAGCVGYHNPEHPCLDLSPETFCNSAIVQGSKAYLATMPTREEQLREREVRALERATQALAAAGDGPGLHDDLRAVGRRSGAMPPDARDQHRRSRSRLLFVRVGPLRGGSSGPSGATRHGTAARKVEPDLAHVNPSRCRRGWRRVPGARAIGCPVTRGGLDLRVVGEHALCYRSATAPPRGTVTYRPHQPTHLL